MFRKLNQLQATVIITAVLPPAIMISVAYFHRYEIFSIDIFEKNYKMFKTANGANKM